MHLPAQVQIQDFYKGGGWPEHDFADVVQRGPMSEGNLGHKNWGWAQMEM